MPSTPASASSVADAAEVVRGDPVDLRRRRRGGTRRGSGPPSRDRYASRRFTYFPTTAIVTGSVARVDPFDERLPFGEVGLGVDPEMARELGVQALLVKDERDLVDGRRVDRARSRR